METRLKFFLSAIVAIFILAVSVPVATAEGPDGQAGGAKSAADKAEKAADKTEAALDEAEAKYKEAAAKARKAAEQSRGAEEELDRLENEALLAEGTVKYWEDRAKKASNEAIDAPPGSKAQKKAREEWNKARKNAEKAREMAKKAKKELDKAAEAERKAYEEKKVARKEKNKAKKAVGEAWEANWDAQWKAYEAAKKAAKEKAEGEAEKKVKEAPKKPEVAEKTYKEAKKKSREAGDKSRKVENARNKAEDKVREAEKKSREAGDKSRKAEKKSREAREKAREAKAKAERAEARAREASVKAMDAKPGSEAQKKARKEWIEARDKAEKARKEAEKAKEELKKAKEAKKKAHEEEKKAWQEEDKAKEDLKKAEEAKKKTKEKAKAPKNLSGCWESKEGYTMTITQNGDQITATITAKGVTRDYSATAAQNKLTLSYQFKDIADFKTGTWEGGEGPPMYILKQAFPLLTSPHLSYQLKIESESMLKGTYLVWSVTYGSDMFSSEYEFDSVDRIEYPVEWTRRLKLSSITITDETFRNALPKVMPGERFWVSAKGSVGCSDIVDRVRVSVYPEEAEESEWIEVELVETGPDTLVFHSSPEGILVAAEEEEEYEEEKEGPEIIEPETPVEVAGEEDEGDGGPPKVISSETVGPRTRQEQQGQPDISPDADDFKEVVGEEWREELAEEETQPGEAPTEVKRTTEIRDLNAEIDRLNIELSSRKKLHAGIQVQPVPVYLRYYTDSTGRMFSRVETTEEPELEEKGVTHVRTEQLLTISAILEALNKEIAGIRQTLRALPVKVN